MTADVRRRASIIVRIFGVVSLSLESSHVDYFLRSVQRASADADENVFTSRKSRPRFALLPSDPLIPPEKKSADLIVADFAAESRGFLRPRD